MPKVKSTDNSYDYEKLKYQIYSEERKLLISTEQEQAKTFDKYILTISSGALGLSLAFIKLIQNIETGSENWLFAAWALFSLSTLSTLISFLTGQAACRRQVKILEASFFPEEQEEKSDDRNPHSTATGILNVSSIALLILGFATFIIFAFQNIKTIELKEELMTKKGTPEKPLSGVKPPQQPRVPLEKGIKVPNVPKEPPKPKK